MVSRRLASTSGVIDVFNVLGQLLPSGNVLTSFYIVGSEVQTVASSILVCNQSSSLGSYRISIAIAGAIDSREQYAYYDTPINGNDTFVATIGITLGPDDEIRVYSSNGLMSFMLFGDEITGT